MRVLIPLAGVGAVLFFAWLLSSHRRAINLRTVLVAFIIQAGVAAFIFAVPWGRQALAGVVRGVQHVINFANDGIAFVFGEQVTPTLGFTIAFNVLPAIVFFAALMSALYYLGVMQLVVGIIGGGLERLLKISKAESVSAASNIFVGHTEAPLVVRPYLANMTQSELFAVMVGGCATIAGGVMMAYASMGIDVGYLLTASFMAAPGGLLIAKIMLPETGQPLPQTGEGTLATEVRPVNIFEAIGNGAMTGLSVALSVGALLVAFVAIIYLLNGLIGWAGGLVGVEGLTLQQILGLLFAPVAWLLGVPWAEAATAGSLIGQKLVLNEFYAYAAFIEVRDDLSPYTQLVVTFALCGFSNLSSIAILLGGLGAVVPERRQDIARFGLRAVIGGTLVNLVNAALAGLFFTLKGL
jgi:CNT family concentrative nucleoside transporter